MFSNESGVDIFKTQKKEDVHVSNSVPSPRRESNIDTELNNSLLSEIEVNLLSLKKLARYFQDISYTHFPLVRSPFTFEVCEIP
jgi:hypothetical protein